MKRILCTLLGVILVSGCSEGPLEPGSLSDAQRGPTRGSSRPEARPVQEWVYEPVEPGSVGYRLVEVGGTLTLDILVHSQAPVIDAWTLDVFVNPTVLRKLSHSPGNLTEGWGLLGMAPQPEAGKYIVGGFTNSVDEGGPIYPDTQGSIFRVVFERPWGGTIEPYIVISDMRDDLSDYTFARPEVVGCLSVGDFQTQVEIPIHITVGHRPLATYEFTVDFDSSVLEYANEWRPGPMFTDAWLLKGPTLQPDGRLKVVGVTRGSLNAIPVGTTGVFKYLTFNLVGGLTLENFKGHIEDYVECEL